MSALRRGSTTAVVQGAMWVVVVSTSVAVAISFSWIFFRYISREEGL